MRPMVYILCLLCLIALGSWAYRENYATQTALRDLRDIQQDIAQLHDALAVQRAEWAFLNRPDRLRNLATINFDTLGLLPMEASQFATATDIAYPAPDAGLPPAPLKDAQSLQAPP